MRKNQMMQKKKKWIDLARLTLHPSNKISVKKETRR